MFSRPNIEFAQPWFFLLLLIIPILMIWNYYKGKNYYPTLTMPTLGGLQQATSWRISLRGVIPFLRMSAIAFICIALARPQAPMQGADVTSEGIDIMIAMDVSSSMLAKDFPEDRLESSKKVAIDFVQRRPQDRIGLVAFSGESYTRCPLTTDHVVLNELLSTLQCGTIADGTAIGMGLANAVRRLQQSTAKSKVVILLTDGVNNAGYTAPMQAAEAAKALKIKVYTIGVGTEGRARAPIAIDAQGEYVYGWTEVEIDTDLLTNIAKETGGKYFRATDMEELQGIYAQIDQLERSKIESNAIKRFEERFHLWLWLALFCIATELLLQMTIFRTIVA